ncbi:MAG: hypothetical protein AB1540_13655 [Bdellovibrionota bacterium]
MKRALKRHNLISSLFVTTVFMALVFVSAAAHARSKSGRTQKPMPCDVGFSLDVKVFSPQSSDQGNVGFSVQYEKSKKRGLASRLHSGQSAAVTSEVCRRWQDRYWQVFERVLLENSRPERKDLVCHGVASIEYQLVGSKKQKTKVCLGDRRFDGATYSFHDFYEGTSLLAGR